MKLWIFPEIVNKKIFNQESLFFSKLFVSLV